MKIAITGGSGRVGQGVVAMALVQGHQVVNIDLAGPAGPPASAGQAGRPNLAFIQADITDYDALVNALRGCDALVHLAAIPAPGRLPDHVVHNNNVTGSYNALRAAVEVGIPRICQASSVNATGLAYSRWPHFDYFPLDEQHPTYCEDPYALSKWICEEQASSLARRYATLTIASLRFHGVTSQRPVIQPATSYSDSAIKNLWAYTTLSAAARACLLSLTASFTGHQVFYIVAPETLTDTPSLALQQKYFPDVPVRGDLTGHTSFFDSSKAEGLLGWKHNQ